MYRIEKASIGEWRYQVNNVQVPQYGATPLDALHLVGVAKDDIYIRITEDALLLQIDNGYKITSINLPSPTLKVAVVDTSCRLKTA